MSWTRMGYALGAVGVAALAASIAYLALMGWFLLTGARSLLSGQPHD